MTDLTDIFLRTSIANVSDQLAAGLIKPIDIRNEVERCVGAYEESLRAWTVLNPEKLTCQDQHASVNRYGYRVSGLSGIPFGAKDIFNTRDFVTERGSLIWKEYTPGNNARVIDSLESHGAVLIGKTATSELAVDEESEARNPHNHRHSPGTSSGGSAVACATGMVPFALASQSGASIARPASFTGVFGYKPSLGLVPRTGVLKTADTLDTVGFLTSRADNLRTVLEGMRVRGPDFPFVFSKVDSSPDTLVPEWGRWRLGVLRTPWWENSVESVRAGFDRILERIAGLRQVELVETPWLPQLDEVHRLHDLIYCKSLAYYFTEEYERNEGSLSTVLAHRLERGRATVGQQYIDALINQDLISRALQAHLCEYDAVLTLSTSQEAPLLFEFPMSDPSLIWTFTGVPAAAFPLELSSTGLPVGAQLISQRWNDFKVISLLEMLVQCGVITDRSLPIKK